MCTKQDVCVIYLLPWQSSRSRMRDCMQLANHAPGSAAVFSWRPLPTKWSSQAGGCSRQMPNPAHARLVHSIHTTPTATTPPQLQPTLLAAVHPAQRVCPCSHSRRPPLLKVRLLYVALLFPTTCLRRPRTLMPRCTAISRAPTAWLPQDSCIRLAHSDSQNRALSPVLASVLAYGVLSSETQ